MDPTSTVDPTLSNIVVGLGVAVIGGIFTVVVALINRVGKRKSEDTERVAGFVAIVQADNVALRSEVASLRKELRQIEELRRDDFRDAVAKYFPETVDDAPLSLATENDSH